MTAGSGTGAAKNGGRTATSAPRTFCCGSLAPSGLAAVPLPAGFGVPSPTDVRPAVGTATCVACAGGVASGPKSAAKLPQVREPEFPGLNKPADAAEVMPFAIAGSMAEVTMNGPEPMEKTHSPWMHLGHQPGEAPRVRYEAEETPWNQGNGNLVDGRERMAGV